MPHTKSARMFRTIAVGCNARWSNLSVLAPVITQVMGLALSLDFTAPCAVHGGTRSGIADRRTGYLLATHICLPRDRLQVIRPNASTVQTGRIRRTVSRARMAQVVPLEPLWRPAHKIVVSEPRASNAIAEVSVPVRADSPGPRPAAIFTKFFADLRPEVLLGRWSLVNASRHGFLHTNLAQFNTVAN